MNQTSKAGWHCLKEELWCLGLCQPRQFSLYKQLPQWSWNLEVISSESERGKKMAVIQLEVNSLVLEFPSVEVARHWLRGVSLPAQDQTKPLLQSLKWCILKCSWPYGRCAYSVTEMTDRDDRLRWPTEMTDWDDRLRWPTEVISWGDVCSNDTQSLCVEWIIRWGHVLPPFADIGLLSCLFLSFELSFLACVCRVSFNFCNCFSSRWFGLLRLAAPAPTKVTEVKKIVSCCLS
jgi:hypothetical protein